MPRLARWLPLVVTLAAACDAPALSHDAGPDATLDARSSGRLTVALRAPEFAYVDQETCVELDYEAAADAAITWTWGDGTVDESIGTRRACHTWAFPGPLVMGAQVRARGMRAEATALLHVVFEPAAIRPTASSTIAYEVSRDRVWVVSPDASSVAVIDATTRTRLAQIEVGARPRTLAIVGDDVLVACAGEGSVDVIDAATLTRRARVALGSGGGTHPYGVVADPRGGRAWVTLQGSGELVAIELPAARVAARVDVGADPRALAMRADGLLAITRWRSTQDAAVVYLVDASDPDAPGASREALLPREEGVDSDTDNDGVLSFLDTLLPTPDASRVLVFALKANVVAGLARSGAPLTSQTTVRAALAELALGGVAEPARDTYRFPFDDLGYASAALASPMGDRFYVAMQGAEVVVAIDAFSFDSVGSIDDVGHAPRGLALDPSGRWLFVDASLSRSVRVYDVSDLSREPALAAEIPTVEVEPLSAEVLAGAIVFHRSRDARMSRTRYLSCASCHLDGEADGLVWDFTQRGEGLRNTIPLRGRGGPAHGPMHWSANFDEVQDFEHDIRAGQGGAGFLADDVFHSGTRDTTLGDPKAGLSPELDALAAYVSSLSQVDVSPHRTGDAAWSAAFARGEAIFEDAARGCVGCHAPPRYTDSRLEAGVPLLHDVGTLRPTSGQRLGAPLSGLDTPTLLGLWSSAPYLHDGSAATLREVLVDRNTADVHGVTSDLSESQLRDLETFLLSL